MRTLLLTLLLLCRAATASAGLTEHDLGQVSLTPPSNAAAPLDLLFRDADGRRATLRERIGGRPALVLFADYTCRTVCKPALAIAAGALAEAGLTAGSDYRLLVIGLDPKDTAADAKELLNQIGDPAVASATAALMNDGDNAARLAAATGYRFAYDAYIDQFAHPAGLVVLTATGRVSRVLSSLALNTQDIRLAVIEAGEGRVGRIQDRLTLLCYGFDAVHGIYTPLIWAALEIGAAGIVIAIAGLIFLLWRRDVRAREHAA